MTHLHNIGAHNTYDVIQDGAEKLHERRTANDERRTTNDEQRTTKLVTALVAQNVQD